ncbi:unnamed protein product [Coffea canephora]|uniref:K-box domain-containing protein n=1 Tax=Coffea canephora TaxID=49390 RepID=A0A068UYD4_COFCA|nr:unnamed protein product [Coffea canephora]
MLSLLVFVQYFEEEVAILRNKVQLLEETKRLKFLRDGLDASSLDELQQIEDQLEKSLSIYSLLFWERIYQLKEEEKFLKKENAELQEKAGYSCYS